MVAATTLGGLRINDRMDNIQQLDHMKLLTHMTKQATELAAALQEERDRSAGPLAHGANAQRLQGQGTAQEDRRREHRVHRRTASYRRHRRATTTSSACPQQPRQPSSASSAARDIRARRLRDAAQLSQTVDAYSQPHHALLDLSQDMAQATSNPEMIQRTRALAAFSSAKEYASVQRAVLAAALPANNTTVGTLSENDRLYAESRATEPGLRTAQSFKTHLRHGLAERPDSPSQENGNPDDHGRRQLRAAVPRHHGRPDRPGAAVVPGLVRQPTQDHSR